MQSHYRYKRTRCAISGNVTLPEDKALSRIAVAVEGVHGTEGVYCVAEINGSLTGFPERAPGYKANQWEHRVLDSDKNNTFYMDIPDEYRGSSIKISAVFSDHEKAHNCSCDVYAIPDHD